MAGIFDTGVFNTGIFDHPNGIFDTGIFDRNIFDNILGPVTAGQTFGGGPGFALSFRQERDWQKIRRAREEIRTALEAAISGSKKQRQAAAQKAAAAISDVVQFIRQPGDEAWDDVLADLERLMAMLDGAVKQAEARAAAEEWARIEDEYRAQQQFLEEELLVVLALAS